jgi:hypothetical protein
MRHDEGMRPVLLPIVRGVLSTGVRSPMTLFPEMRQCVQQKDYAHAI